jgi:GNAT superfamily N-acetyltransferase
MLEIKKLDVILDGIEYSKFIALVEDQFIGCVDLQIQTATSASFRALFVHEDYRHQEIGFKLILACEQAAEKAGCKYLGAQVDRGNLDVLPFYEKLGFMPCYQHDDGTLIITMRLGEPPTKILPDE